jgi:hypothetical protein
MKIYRRLRDRVHDRADETHWGLTHGAAGANLFQQSCDTCHPLVARRAVSGVISSETPSCASARRFSG